MVAFAQAIDSQAIYMISGTRPVCHNEAMDYIPHFGTFPNLFRVAII